MPALFAHFDFIGGHVVCHSLLSCLPSRFPPVRSLYWVLGFFGVRQSYNCVGVDRHDDYSADSSAGLVLCGFIGVFFSEFWRFSR